MSQHRLAWYLRQQNGLLMGLHDQDFLADLYLVASPLLVVLCELQPGVARTMVELVVGAVEVAVDIAVVGVLAAVAEVVEMQEVANTRPGGRSLDAAEEAVGNVVGPEEGFVVEAVEGN